MKTQIISLESHDDLVSIRDKLSWVKTPRVLLVWPKYANVNLRALDLKVLQRHAAACGTQLGLVTRRMSVKRDAESFDIPVFDSTNAAQKGYWTPSAAKSTRKPKPPRRDLRAQKEEVRVKEAEWKSRLSTRVGMFTAAVLSVLAVASLFVPRAAIVVYPEAKTQSMVIPITADSTLASVVLPGIVPARSSEVVVSGSQSVSVTSALVIPLEKAQGIARFRNLTTQEILIPQGMVAYAPGETAIRFATLHATRLKGGIGEFVEIPIEAVEAGSEANLPASSINAVEGQLGLSLTVTNPEPTSGGTDKKVVGPSDEDRQQTHDLLMERLETEAAEQLTVSLSPNALPLLNTLSVSVVEEETYDPPVGQPGTTLTMNLRVKFAAQHVTLDDVRHIAAVVMDPAMPDGFIPAPEEKIALRSVNEPAATENGNTAFEMSAERDLIRRITYGEVFALTRGRGWNSARDALMSELSMRQPPDIELSPSWWPFMPLFAFRTDVSVN